MSIKHIPLLLIRPAARQARSMVDPNSPAIEALAESIRNQGVLQAITVYRDEDEYVIVLGERRYHGARKAKLATIPAIVLAQRPDARTVREWQLVENLQRENISPFDEGQGYLELQEACGLTHDEIGKRVGKSRTHVLRAISIARLPEDIRFAALASQEEGRGEIPFEHLSEVAKLDDATAQRRLMAEIIEYRPSVRELRDNLREMQGRTGGDNVRRKSEPMQSSRQFRDPQGRFWATLHFAAQNPSLHEVEMALEKMLDDVRRAIARGRATSAQVA